MASHLRTRTGGYDEGVVKVKVKVKVKVVGVMRMIAVVPPIFTTSIGHRGT